jgi:hypothetical protein
MVQRKRKTNSKKLKIDSRFHGNDKKERNLQKHNVNAKNPIMVIGNSDVTELLR